jgi:alpha-1,3-glucosyltransferase
VQKYILLKPFFSQRAVALIILLGITLRIAVGLGPYSGQGDWPNLGDFEAHRNWMSITLNRDITSWYEEHDDKPWWRIDYPPVAAYLSYLFGKIYHTVEPEAMNLRSGYESENLKAFMRFSSLLVDLLFLFPPIYALSTLFQRKLPQLFLLMLMLKPDAILIDHGHFQYNSLILGLILGAFYCLLTDRFYLACLLYTSAIHSKQMAVYYSLAFLAALIGLTYQRHKYNKLQVVGEVVKYGTIVIITSLLIWLPWLGSTEDLQTVLAAIFPVHRGLYQLKVGNFWCITDTFLNWERHFNKSTLVALCFLTSLLASVPSMLSLILRPTRKALVMGFATISLTFFMFSYHVHEKSILLPLLMMPFVGETIGGWLSFEMVVAGCAGMFHLLKEDNQEFGYFGVMVVYVLIGIAYTRLRAKTTPAK